jgi:hypothetical protein
MTRDAAANPKPSSPNTRRGTLMVLVLLMLTASTHGLAQITLEAPFQENLVTDLGSTGFREASRGPVGAMFIDPSNPNILFLSGGKGQTSGAIYRIPIERDSNGSIIAITNWADLSEENRTSVAITRNIGGGVYMEFDSDGNPINVLWSTDSGNSSHEDRFRQKLADADGLLSRVREEYHQTYVKALIEDALGTPPDRCTMGGFAFLPGQAPSDPAPKDGPRSLVVSDRYCDRGGNITLLNYTIDSDGLFSFSFTDSRFIRPLNVSEFGLDSEVGTRPRLASSALVYLPAGTAASGITKPSLLMFDEDESRAFIFEVDAGGLPILNTARKFATGLRPAMATSDPVTGDVIVSYQNNDEDYLAVISFDGGVRTDSPSPDESGDTSNDPPDHADEPANDTDEPTNDTDEPTNEPEEPTDEPKEPSMPETAPAAPNGVRLVPGDRDAWLVFTRMADIPAYEISLSDASTAGAWRRISASDVAFPLSLGQDLDLEVRNDEEVCAQVRVVLDDGLTGNASAVVCATPNEGVSYTPAVNLEIGAPVGAADGAKLNDDGKLEFEFTVVNDGDADLANVWLNPAVPEGSVLVSVEPKDNRGTLTEYDGLWYWEGVELKGDGGKATLRMVVQLEDDR